MMVLDSATFTGEAYNAGDKEDMRVINDVETRQYVLKDVNHYLHFNPQIGLSPGGCALELCSATVY